MRILAPVLYEWRSSFLSSTIPPICKSGHKTKLVYSTTSATASVTSRTRRNSPSYSSNWKRRNSSILTLSLLSLSHSFSLNPITLTQDKSGDIGGGISCSSSSITSLHSMASSSSSSVTSSNKAGIMKCSKDHPLSQMIQNLDSSWIRQLSLEDDKTKHNPDANNEARPVKNGHYVLVTPKPLRNPRLIAYSSDLTQNVLQMANDEQVNSQEFIDFFSGNVKRAFEACLEEGNEDNNKSENSNLVTSSEPVQTWATPYALSIMGTRYTNNCPFGTGEGYGDGRAISIAEVNANNQHQSKYEFQLKGGGPTPFCRRADGRAVLRSSIREFLASEAMHYLGVQTTRALSLIVSDGPDGDVSQRPWYREAVDDNVTVQLPDINDPRLVQYSIEERKAIIERLATQKRDPDMMIAEPNAITCRVSPSFVRIGHIDLFYRRVIKTLNTETNKYDVKSREWKELEQMVWHAGFRDLPASVYQPLYEKKDIKAMTHELLKHSCKGISKMVGHWVRVGFCQGNFNADNCLVAGRTMDYGPFGFMDKYDPLFAKWTGSGAHFGFMNQPQAGFTNYIVLVESVLPLLTTDGENVDSDEGLDLKEKLINEARDVFQNDMDEVWMSKLGFDINTMIDESTDTSDIWEDMEGLLRTYKTDWILIWRQLYHVVKSYPVTGTDTISTDYEEMFELLNGNEITDFGSSPFYEPLPPEGRQEWIEWIRKWRRSLVSSYEQTPTNTTAASPEEIMRLANPKYVLREYLLVEAYKGAAEGDDSILHALHKLIEHPYDEGTDMQHSQYYRRAPDEALTSGGTAFMS